MLCYTRDSFQREPVQLQLLKKAQSWSKTMFVPLSLDIIAVFLHLLALQVTKRFLKSLDSSVIYSQSLVKELCL